MKNDKDSEVIKSETALNELVRELQDRFDQIELKRKSSDENELSELAELAIETFSNSRSIEEFDDLSELIINLAGPENPKKVRLTIAKKLNTNYFFSAIHPTGYNTYKKLILTLSVDPDKEIQDLILKLAEGDTKKYLSDIKSDPELKKSIRRQIKIAKTLDSYSSQFDLVNHRLNLVNSSLVSDAVISAVNSYSSQFDLVNSAVASAVNSYSSQFDLVNSAVNSYSSQINSLPTVSAYYNNIRSSIRALASLSIPDLSYIGIARVSSEISPFWEEDEFEKFEYNWLGFYSPRIIRVFYEEFKNGNEDEVKKFFIDMFKDEDNIQKIKDDLKTNGVFASRMPYIEAALDAHLEGKYMLSIPAFLLQIDGIFIENFSIVLTGKSKGGVCSTCNYQFSPLPNAKSISMELLEPKELIKPIETFGPKKRSEIETSNKIIKFVDRNYYMRYYLQFIINDYRKNRNHILHGKKLDYAEDADYSTKLILALYTLYHLTNETAIIGGDS